MNYFTKLNDINVSDKIEKKGNLSYLSWVYAWGELKKEHPTANNKVYENNEGLNYHTDGRTAWVKVGVIVDGLEHIEYLYIMDNRNNSIPLERITSKDVNNSIQRATVKAIARHGLGLYIYAGEDLPEIKTKPEDAKPEYLESIKKACSEISNEGKLTELWNHTLKHRVFTEESMIALKDIFGKRKQEIKGENNDTK